MMTVCYFTASGNSLMMVYRQIDFLKPVLSMIALRTYPNKPFFSYGSDFIETKV